MDLAVAVVVHHQPGGGLGVAFLAFEQGWLRGRRRRRGRRPRGSVRPRCFRALASWSAASSSRCCSAFSRTSGSRSSGSSARARRMASACSTWTRPSAKRGPGGVVALEAVGEPHRPVRGGAGGPGAGGRASWRSRWLRCCRRGRSGRHAPGLWPRARPAGPWPTESRRGRRWSRRRPSTTPGPRPPR